MATKVEITNEYGKYSVESFEDDLNFTALVELFCACAKASGFSEQTVSAWINGEDLKDGENRHG